MGDLWVSDATADALEGVGEISGSPVCRKFCPSELREGRGGWAAVLGTCPPPADLVDQKKDLSAKTSHLNRAH